MTEGTIPRPDGRPRLLVVSHPNVVTLNQAVYLELVRRGWDVVGVIPANWKDSYRPQGFTPDVMEGLQGRMRLVPVFLPSEQQRHFYRARVGRLVRELAPDIAFVEQEPFSVSGLQWGRALRGAGIPFGLQADENLDRPFPWPAKVIRRWLLPRTRWIAARSPAAGEMCRRWGATGHIGVVPHTVPEFEPQPPRVEGRPFTVGFAGRLIPAKGITDLARAVGGMSGDVRLLIVGDGPLRAEIEALPAPAGGLEVRPGVVNEEMAAAYGEMDVLVLPSRTTETWAEQYGKVLVEAMLCARPVVGADSGEIPWVIATAGGGLTYPEGDVEALRATLERLRDDPAERARLARAGERGAREHFGLAATADALERLLTT